MNNAAVKTNWLLEMSSREQLRPSTRPAPEFELRQVEIPTPEFNWFLHQAIGAAHLWGGRETWGPEEWRKYVDRPELETWVAYIGGSPAGYFELERRDDGSVKIVCFGLVARFHGRGLGAALLARAVERAWEMEPNRIWLNTCSHDHPHALKNYLARGFRIAEETTGPPNPPRESALFGSGVV